VSEKRINQILIHHVGAQANFFRFSEFTSSFVESQVCACEQEGFFDFLKGGTLLKIHINMGLKWGARPI
jgi:hypothetical protein